MELHLLRIFVAIAEEKSLTKAANRLNYVQSNLSARLKQLEEELGCVLFSRTKKGMFPTEQGEKLLSRARIMLQYEQEILGEIKATEPSGHIVLGMPDSFVRTYLAGPLKKWLKDHPASKVKIKTGFSPQIIELLENRIIDIGVVISRKKPPHLHVLRGIPDELCLVTPRHIQNPEAGGLEKLQPMLLGDSCFFGQTLLQLYNNLGIVSVQQEYLFSIETILQCVSFGLGASVFPLSLLQKHPLREQFAIHRYPRKRKFHYYKVCLPARAESQLITQISSYF